MFNMYNLIVFTVITFMGLELAKVLVEKKFKVVPSKKKILYFGILLGFCALFATAAPVFKFQKMDWFMNFLTYFVVEYFAYSFLKEEIGLKLKDFILNKIG